MFSFKRAQRVLSLREAAKKVLFIGPTTMALTETFFKLKIAENEFWLT